MSKIFKFTLGLLLFSTLTYADFTPPTSPYPDPPDSNTKLQCSFDEADGSTTTDDESAGNHTLTNNGNVQTDSGVTKFSNTSLFDGTGDFWNLADSADWAFGSGDFTIDFWVRFNSVSAGCGLVAQDNDGSTDKSFNFWFGTDSGGVLKFWYSTDGTTETNITRPFLASINTWYHIAAVRSGNNFYWYIDGTQSGATGDLTGVTLYNSTSDLIIGAWTDTGGSAFNGWMDELRISNIARDFITASGKQFIMITKFINNLNPDKIGTPMWSCKIKVMKWWKNFTWEFKV